MRKDNRKFCASISVRNGEERAKLELSPASPYGGPEDGYRVRLNRHWLDMEDGEPRFFNRDGLNDLVTGLVLGELKMPAPAPDIPCNSRVSVRRADGFYEGTWTNSEPILDYAGRWMVNVSLGGKRVFVPVEDVTVHKERRRG